MKRTAIVMQDEDGRWVAEIPSMPGCISQGDTRDDAIRNIAEAAELWLETRRDLGLPIPDENVTVTTVNVSAA